MQDTGSSKPLPWGIILLAGNLLVMIVGAGGLILGLLPKMERAVQTTERLEARFQAFADEVQPVVGASANKAIETINQMDSRQLSDSATQKTDQLMDAATERAKRFLERDQTQGE